MQRHFLPIIILVVVHNVISLDICQDSYIIRHIWTNRQQSKNICCKKVTENCKPGHYVKICRSNLSRDVCTPCPGTTWLADETNSSNVHECVHYSCSKGAKRVDYLPKSGCHMPCVCDTERSFYGFDSCNCKLRVFEGTCPANTKLALDGTCLSYRDAEEMNDLKPKDGSIDIPITVIKKKSGTKDDSSINSDNFWLVNKKWIIIGFVLLAIVLILISICYGVFIRRRTCKRDTHDEENPANPTESVSNVSDSGVSFTTSSSVYELCENHHEQQKLIKIDVQHKSDQTEEKMDINCLSDQREDRTSEPCQQTTWFEKNEQDQIVEPCINHEDTTMCHTNVSENISKYSPQRETSKYCPQREKQVAMITPLRSENDMMVKETEPLLGSSDGGGGYPENQIQLQRPPHINDPDLNEDNTRTGFTPMHHDFGSSLHMTNSLIDVSDT